MPTITANPPAPYALQRAPDWPERFAQWVHHRMTRPFEWGRHDCATFATGCVAHLTDTDILHPLQPTWRTETAAARVIRAGGGLLAMAQARLPRRDTPAHAVRGDLVCVDLDGRPTLGIVGGNGHWCAPGERGLVWRPMAEVQHVFAV